MKFALQERQGQVVKVYYQGGVQPASSDEQDMAALLTEACRNIEAAGEAILGLAKKCKLTKAEAEVLERFYGSLVDFVEIRVRGQG